MKSTKWNSVTADWNQKSNCFNLTWNCEIRKTENVNLFFFSVVPVLCILMILMALQIFESNGIPEIYMFGLGF